MDRPPRANRAKPNDVMRFVLAAVLALYGSAVGLLALFQRHLIYPGAFRAVAAQPEREAPEGTSAIVVETDDGERLFGFWRPPDPGCGVVLTFHGNASRPEPHAARFVGGPWRTHGWGVLAIAYRGYPGSTGAPSEAGLIADGLAAHRAVTARAPDAAILLHGHSLGTAVAIAVAERVPHLGLYLEAPFNALDHLVRLKFPYVPNWFLRDTFRSDLRIAKASGPVLIVHGTDDPVVPLKHAHKLAEAAGPPARMVVVAGDHMSILGTQDAEAEAGFRPRGPDACATMERAGTP